MAPGDIPALVPQDPQPAPQPTILDDIRRLVRTGGERLTREVDDHLQTVHRQAIRSDPGAAAEAQKVARGLGLQPEAVDNNRDVALEMFRRQEFRRRDVMRTSPVVAEALRNINFARIAWDDLDNLQATESLFGRIGQAFELGQLQQEEGLIGAKAAIGLMDEVDRRRLKFLRERMQGIPESTGFLQNAAEVVGQMSQSLPLAFATGGAAALAAAQGGPVSAATAFVYGTGAAAFTQSAAVEGGHAFLEMVDAGYDEGLSAAAAFGVGIVNGALEVVGLRLLGKPFAAAFRRQAGEKLAEALVQRTRGQAWRTFAKDYLRGGLGETATEIAQEGVQIVGDELARLSRPDLESRLATAAGREEILDRIVGVAGKTLQAMALLAAPGPGLRFAADLRRATEAQRHGKLIAQTAKLATESQVAGRDPDAYHVAVGSMAQRAGTEALYVDAPQAVEVLSQAGVTVDQLRQQAPELAARLQQAAATGEVVEVPMAEFHARLVRTDAGKALLPHLRLEPDGQSPAEAEQVLAKAKAMVAEGRQAVEERAAADQEFAESAERVRESMRQQLVATERVADRDARAFATFYRDFVAIQAQDSGVTPEQFEERRGLRVVAEDAPRPSGEALGQAARDEPPAGETGKPGEPGVPATASPSGTTSGTVGTGTLAKTGAEGERRGSYIPSLHTAVLHQKADLSTFLHEAAHHFLALYGDLASQPNAPPRVVRDMQTLLDWFGVHDLATWNAMSLDQQRKHHEAFAYNFELWVFEGKAPSREMEGVFMRFARWLRRVYRSMREELGALFRKETGQDLPALTGEVRSVMSRMVASEEAIQEAEAVRDMVPMFQTQEQAGMTDEQWGTYKAALVEAHEQAVTDFDRASQRQAKWLSGARSRVLRELQAEANAAREAMRDEVAVEVQAQPVYRARQWLQHGTMRAADGTTQQGDPDTNHKLNREAVQSMALGGLDTDKIAAALSANGRMPDQVAQAFGFETGEQMVRELITAPPVKDAISARTDERMLDEHGELVDPADREAEMQRALHNEARARFVAVQLRHLSKATEPTRLMNAAAREAARQLLDGRSVGSIRPVVFEAAERRTALEAAKAGDPSAAIVAARQQLLQHHLVKEALAVREQVRKAQDRFDRFGQSDERVAKARDVDYVRAGRALLAVFGLRPPAATQQQQELTAAAMARLATEAPVLASRIADLQRAAAEAKGDWRRAPLAVFRELDEVLEALWTDAHSARFVDLAGQKVAIDEAVQELGEQVVRLPPRPPTTRGPGGETPSPIRRWILRGWNALASLKRHEHWTRFMDGGRPGGPFTRFLDAPIRRAVDIYRAAKASLVREMHPRLMALREHAGAKWHGRLAAPELFDARDPLSKGYTFKGKKELIGALLHAGNESNLRKLLLGRGWATELADGTLDTTRWTQFKERVFAEGWITKEDVDFIRFVWGLYAELLPQAQRAHRAMYGHEFETLQLQPLATPFGILDGGYVPARVDYDEADPQLRRQMDSLEGEQFASQYALPTGRGFTQQRNPNYLQPLDLNLGRQMQHLDAELRFIHLQPAVRGVLRIVRRQEFRNALDAYDREAAGRIILPFLDNTVRQSVARASDQPAIDTAATWLRAAASLAGLGFNFINAALQITGISNAASQVRARYLLSAVWQWRGAPFETVNQTKERSAFMRDRLDDQTRKLQEEMGRQTDPGLIPGAKATRQTLARWAFLPQRLVQAVADIVTWNGAYQQAIAEGVSEGTAVERADGAVRRAQGSGNAEDLAAYESGSPAMRLLTQFGSYSNLVFNQLLGASKGQKAAAVALALLLPALLEGGIRAALAGVDDRDDDGDIDAMDLLAHEGLALARNVTGLIPVVGPMALSAASGDADRIASSPAAGTLAAMVRGLRAAVTPGDGFTESEIRAIATLLTATTGLPLVPVARVLDEELATR